MLFSVGTRVRFVHTGDEGEVTALLDHDMVNVLLDETGMEIPAFIDDLIRAEEYIDEYPSVKASIVPGKKPKIVKAPDRPPIESQYAILKSLGIQLAFDPVVNQEGLTEHYEYYLVNDTRHDALFSIELSLKGKAPKKFTGKIGAVSAQQIGELLFDQLNDAPVFEVECWRINTDGTGPALKKILKIKPKVFFKKVRTAPILNKSVHLYRLFDKLSPPKLVTDKEEDLKTYTQRNIQHPRFWPDLHRRIPHDVMEYAAFIPEIDLHINKLVEEPGKLSKSEILRIQMQHFEAYIQKAILLGVNRVFVIHGIGKGRLRDTIASRLIRIPEVKTFVNEFHPKYGYGATEVVFE